MGDFLNISSWLSIMKQINISQLLDLIIDYVKIWKIQEKTIEIV